MKKAIFLLFVCLIGLAMIKQSRPTKLERIDVVRYHKLDFDGVLYVPLTLHFGDLPPTTTKLGYVAVTVGDNTLRYYRRYEISTNTYWLDQKLDYLDVKEGDIVHIDVRAANVPRNVPVKLFFGREI